MDRKAQHGRAGESRRSHEGVAEVRKVPKVTKVIGLIGAIGAGKSTVAAMLRESGCLVCDSDALARAAYEDPAIRDEVVRWWGSGVLDSRGRIDRARIAEQVFAPLGASTAQQSACGNARQRLEALVHPWIEAKRREVFKSALPTTKAFVIDAPLLIEAGLRAECDAILFVDAPREVRLARLHASRGWDAAELSRREKSQMPLDLKRGFAHHVINNDTDLESLRAQVARILSLII